MVDVRLEKFEDTESPTGFFRVDRSLRSTICWPLSTVLDPDETFTKQWELRLALRELVGYLEQLQHGGDTGVADFPKEHQLAVCQLHKVLKNVLQITNDSDRIFKMFETRFKEIDGVEDAGKMLRLYIEMVLKTKCLFEEHVEWENALQFEPSDLDEVAKRLKKLLKRLNAMRVKCGLPKTELLKDVPDVDHEYDWKSLDDVEEQLNALEASLEKQGPFHLGTFGGHVEQIEREAWEYNTPGEEDVTRFGVIAVLSRKQQYLDRQRAKAANATKDGVSRLIESLRPRFVRPEDEKMDFVGPEDDEKMDKLQKLMDRVFDSNDVEKMHDLEVWLNKVEQTLSSCEEQGDIQTFNWDEDDFQGKFGKYLPKEKDESGGESKNEPESEKNEESEPISHIFMSLLFYALIAFGVFSFLPSKEEEPNAEAEAAEPEADGEAADPVEAEV